MRILLFLIVSVFIVVCGPASAQTIAENLAGGHGLLTAEQLKELLSTPRYLFFVMLLASFGNMIKQKSDANRNGASVTLGGYLSHWPETFSTIVANVLAFVALIMTDQLNFAAALGVGYGLNSLVDLTRSGGRSASLQTSSAPVEPKT